MVSTRALAARFAQVALGVSAMCVPLSAEAAGAVVGHIHYVGSKTAPPAIAVPGGFGMCGTTVPAETLLVGAGKGLANAVVSIGGVKGSPPPAPAAVTITEKGCVFSPHVVAFPVASKLTFLNEDEMFHNVHLESGGQTLTNLATPIKGWKTDAPANLLTKATTISMKCDVHAWMKAYFHIFDHPFYAVTDATGSYRIEGLPAGTYDFVVDHETLGTSTRKVTVPASGEVTMDVDLK